MKHFRLFTFVLLTGLFFISPGQIHAQEVPDTLVDELSDESLIFEKSEAVKVIVRTPNDAFPDPDRLRRTDISLQYVTYNVQDITYFKALFFNQQDWVPEILTFSVSTDNENWVEVTDTFRIGQIMTDADAGWGYNYLIGELESGGYNYLKIEFEGEFKENWAHSPQLGHIQINVKDTTTIADVVTESEAHDTLEIALSEAQLTETLEGEEYYTLFAPTDTAFAELEDGVLEDLLADPTGELAEILKYHVIPGAVVRKNLLDNREYTTLQGEVLQFRQDAVTGELLVNGARVITENIVTENGVVHVIDSVVAPPTTPESVVTIVTESELHTTLETAVVAAALDDDLSGDGPFTVFAPTDEAFDALPAGTLDELLEDPEGELAYILQYHVVPGSYFAADLSDGMQLATLQGTSITINFLGDIVLINGTASVVETDLESRNGVVHVIDEVLLDVLSVENVDNPQSKVALFPNPVSDKTNIMMRLSEPTHVSFEIYNMLGSKVKAVDAGFFTNGTHSIPLMVRDLEAGYYFLRITGNHNTLTKKFQVVR